MKRKILTVIVVFAMLIGSIVLTALPSSAVVHNYGIFVGGVEITAENASDVLGDGTVSYDAATNTLTLNGANITEYLTQEYNGEDCFYGIYSTVDGLTINLVGQNKIVVEGDEIEDTASAIWSEKSLTISGEGSIDIKCWCGVICMDDLTVKDCKMSFSTLGITGMKDVTVEGATLSSDFALMMVPNGDITIKNTTITEGGIGTAIMTELGNIFIENSSITTNCTEGEDSCPIYTGDKLTVKNTAFNISASGAMAIMCGKLDFDGVTGSIEMTCEAGYAIMGADVKMKNCDLDIEVVATKDSAFGIFSEQDVSLENSSLKIDVRGSKDVAIGIGTLEGSIKADNSTLDIVAKNKGAFALYGSNVALTDCSLVAQVTAIATEDTFGAGIFTENGTVKLIGGVIDLTVSGPVLESPQISSGINMTNTLLQPELTGVNLKIKAPVVMTSAPYLTLYGREYEITVSEDIYGDTPVDYNAENILTYKYFDIHGLYTVTYDANGGTGTMEGEEDCYGLMILPINEFTAPEGKQFLGWAYTADGEVISETSFTIQKDITLYAIWVDLPGNEPGNEDPDHTHTYGADWTQTADEHYKACICGMKQYQGTHVDSNANGSCDICGYVTAENSDEGLGTGAVIGIVCGSVAVVGIGGFSLLWFVIKKKSFADLIAIFKKG